MEISRRMVDSSVIRPNLPHVDFMKLRIHYFRCVKLGFWHATRVLTWVTCKSPPRLAVVTFDLPHLQRKSVVLLLWDPQAYLITKLQAAILKHLESVQQCLSFKAFDPINPGFFVSIWQTDHSRQPLPISRPLITVGKGRTETRSMIV